MLTHTSRWSHARGNAVVPSRWQATFCDRTARGCMRSAYEGRDRMTAMERA